MARLAALASICTLLASLPAQAELFAYEARFEIVSQNPTFEVPDGLGPMLATGVTERVVQPSMIALPTFVPAFAPNTPLGQQRAFVFGVTVGPDLGFDQIDFTVGHLTLITGTPALLDPTLPVRGRGGLAITGGPVGPLTAGTGATGVGVGGPTLVHTTPTTSYRRISIQGAPWTLHAAVASDQTGTGLVVQYTSVGFVHGPLSATASALDPGGVLRAVTPIQMRVAEGPLLAPTFTRRAGFFGRLEVRILPESGLAIPLALGAAMLCVLGRRRLRQRTLRDSR